MRTNSLIGQHGWPAPESDFDREGNPERLPPRYLLRDGRSALLPARGQSGEIDRHEGRLARPARTAGGPFEEALRGFDGEPRFTRILTAPKIRTSIPNVRKVNGSTFVLRNETGVPRYYVFLPSIELRVKLLEDDEV